MPGLLRCTKKCVVCGSEFRPTNWLQRHCKPCGLPAEAERQRQWQRAYYAANSEAILARIKVRRALRMRGAPPVKKGHHYTPPKSPFDCMRCGADFAPNSSIQRFCPACRDLARSELANSRRLSNREYRREYHRRFKERLWRLVFGHYSNGTFACICCGEGERDFLVLDHVNNDGWKQRKQGIRPGGNFYHWLAKNGLPTGVQVLCANCNTSKMKHGVCIHKMGLPPPTTLEPWIR